MELLLVALVVAAFAWLAAVGEESRPSFQDPRVQDDWSWR